MTATHWGRTQRDRMGLPPTKEVVVEEVTHASKSPGHFHVWAEVGYGGTLSPAYATIEDASRAVREVADELGATIVASTSYPLMQVFLRVPVTRTLEGPDRRPAEHPSVHVNVTLRQRCVVKCDNTRGAWS